MGGHESNLRHGNGNGNEVSMRKAHEVIISEREGVCPL